MQVRPAPPDELGRRLERLITEVEEQQGAAPFGEALLAAMAEPGGGGGIGAAAFEGGEPAAYGFAAPNPDGRAWTVEAAAPAELYGWFLGEVLDRLAAEGAGEAVVWVHAPGLEPPSGLVTLERELLRMGVGLPPAGGGGPPPEGAVLRGLRPGRDEAALLELNNLVFAGHSEQGGWTRRDLDRRTALPWFDPDGVRTIWIEGRMAAFNWTKVHPAPAPGGRPLGEIYAIGVDPRRRGRGLGRAAAAEGLRHLRVERGADRAFLYVDSSNEAALGLYRSLGFEAEHADRAYRWTAGR